MLKPLTKRQREILDYLEQSINEQGFAPSYREIADHFALSSPATISDHIEMLVHKGYLRVDPNRARSIQLNDPEFSERFEIPLVGTIAAGSPIEAITTDETIMIPPDMNGHNVFALQVKGSSMIDDGIFDGDYVVIQQMEVPNNGDIVVALVDNENVTLKRFYKEKGHIRLQPANQSMQPIIVKNVTVQGKVKGVIRKFE